MTEDLSTNIGQALTDLDYFCSEGNTFMKNYLRQFQENYRENEKKIHLLSQTKRQLEISIDSSQKEREIEIQTISTLETKLQELKLEQNSIPTHYENTVKQLQENEKIFEKKEIEFKDQQNEIFERFSILKKSVSMFENRLGLSIVYLETNAIRFIFTKIDPKIQDRKFVIDLSPTSQQNKYRVSHCQPSIQYEEPLEYFNRNKNYRIFFFTIRELFKDRI